MISEMIELPLLKKKAKREGRRRDKNNNTKQLPAGFGSRNVWVKRMHLTYYNIVIVRVNVGQKTLRNKYIVRKDWGKKILIMSAMYFSHLHHDTYKMSLTFDVSISVCYGIVAYSFMCSPFNIQQSLQLMHKSARKLLLKIYILYTI